MSRLFKILLSLLVTLPAAAVFSILCYFLVLNYEEWYSTLKGPILGLLTLVLGLYTLVSPLVIYHYLGRFGIKQTLTRYLVRPLIYDLPILALITALVMLWAYYTQQSMQWATSAFNDNFILLFSLLMLGQEVMKFSARKHQLETYFKSTKPKQPNLKFTPFQLQVLCYLQSFLYAFITWTLCVLLIACIQYFIASFSSSYLKTMASLLAMILVFWGMVRSEWLLEKYGRDQFYIPWNSNK